LVSVEERIVNRATDAVDYYKRYNSIYRDCWQVIPLETLLHLLAFKATRLRFIDAVENPDKFEDELIDIINYCAIISLKAEELRYEVSGDSSDT